MITRLYSAILQNSLLSSLFLLSVGFQLQAQSTFTLLDSIQVEGVLIAADKLSQIYIHTEAGQINKIDQSGQFLFQFSDNTLGELSYLDTNDPFNILAFYKDFQLAVVLDRTLNPNITYDFANLELFNVQAVAVGFKNQIWCYDRQLGKLVQLDDNGRITRESQDLNLLIGIRPDISTIQVFNNQLWLLAPESGIYWFDQFGQLVRQIPSEGVQEIIVLTNNLLIKSSTGWQMLNLLSQQWLDTNLPKSNFEYLKLIGNKLFAQKDNTVFIYKIEE